MGSAPDQTAPTIPVEGEAGQIEIEIPVQLEDRPFYKGLPVPYTIPWDKDPITGTYKPDFRKIDPFKWKTVIENGRCGICGNRLTPRMFFVGGPNAVEQGLFLDPPMHESCARYAMAVCPYFLGRDTEGDNGELRQVSATAHGYRPPRFFLVMASNYKIVKSEGGTHYLRPDDAVVMDL